MNIIFLLIVVISIPIYFIYIKPYKEQKEQEKRWADEKRRQELVQQEKERRKREEEELQRLHEQRLQTDSSYARQYNRIQQRARENAEAARRRKEEEAQLKRQEEIKRRNELKAKFHYIKLGGFSAAYRYDYYPKNRYPFIDATNESNRRAVWSFKDGSSSIGVSILSDFLEGNYTKEQMSNLVLCVIPASTTNKNEARYKTMCSQVCSRFQILNGFSYIQIVYDRSNSREQKSSNTIANLTFSGPISGKDVILFDDITTRGTSFIQVANELKKIGARTVYGVFIGKTVGF